MPGAGCFPVPVRKKFQKKSTKNDISRHRFPAPSVTSWFPGTLKVEESLGWRLVRARIRTKRASRLNGFDLDLDLTVWIWIWGFGFGFGGLDLDLGFVLDLDLDLMVWIWKRTKWFGLGWFGFGFGEQSGLDWGGLDLDLANKVVWIWIGWFGFSEQEGFGRHMVNPGENDRYCKPLTKPC